jgi:hypothetical protein
MGHWLLVRHAIARPFLLLPVLLEVWNGAKTMEQAARFLTRRELAGFLTKHGFPISYSTLLKMAMPSRNEGPPPVGYWGNRALYDGEKALAWAQKRFRANWREAQPVMTNHEALGEKTGRLK